MDCSSIAHESLSFLIIVVVELAVCCCCFFSHDSAAVSMSAAIASSGLGKDPYTADRPIFFSKLVTSASRAIRLCDSGMLTLLLLLLKFDLPRRGEELVVDVLTIFCAESTDTTVVELFVARCGARDGRCCC